MPYDSLKIANYFLQQHIGDNITPMKLTKLVYIAHGWYLGLTSESLISETAEAWKYGPVIPSIYHKFKAYKNGKITKPLDLTAISDQETIQFLDKIWEEYGRYSAIELSTKTHQTDTPWYKVWNSIENKETTSLKIPNDLIESYYKGLLANNLERQIAST